MFDWILNISFILEIDTIIKFFVRNNLFVDSFSTWPASLGGWPVFQEKEKGNIWPHLTLNCPPMKYIILIEKGTVTGRPSLPLFCPIGAQKGCKSVTLLFSKNGWLCGFKFILVTPDPLQQLVVSFSQMSWIYVIS